MSTKLRQALEPELYPDLSAHVATSRVQLDGISLCRGENGF